MKDSPRFPPFFWRVMSRANRWILSRYGARSKAASRVLVLTTVGRKSGLPRLTPLQFEEVEGVFYVVSARGEQADWYRNLLTCPQVDVQVGGKHFSTLARPMVGRGQIADYLELRLKKYPIFMGVLLRLEGLPRKCTRTDLEKFAERLAIVELPQNIR